MPAAARPPAVLTEALTLRVSRPRPSAQNDLLQP
jgi:hypothetical protein